MDRLIELQEQSLSVLQEILRAVQPKGITINTEFYPQDDNTPMFDTHEKVNSPLHMNCERCNGG